MAVSKFKIVSIIGTVPSLDIVSKVCGECGYFQPINILEFYPKTKGLLPFTESNPYSDLIRKIKDASLVFGETLNFVDITNFNVELSNIKEFVNELSIKAKNLNDSKKEIVKKINEKEKDLELIKHFCGLDLNLEEIFKCEYIKVRFGRLSKESFKKIESTKEDSFIKFFPCTEESGYYWGIYFAPLENLKEIDNFFSDLYFEYVDVNKENFSVSPEISVKEIEEIIKKDKENLKNIELAFNKFWKTQKEQCFRFYTKLTELDSYFYIKKHSYIHDESFFLMGWIPEENEISFCNKLEEIDGIEYNTEETETKTEMERAPVKLKNNWFSKPFESFIKMYGLPKYKEFDPTTFVAITFTLLYGIMFGDLGHGLVLFILGLFFKKKFSLAPVMIRCGASASLFGTLYGSVFGFENALNPFYKFLFSLNEKPIEVMSAASIPKIIAAAVILGVILVILAMIINIISSFKNKDIENGIFGPNGICGLVFYVSVLIGAVFEFLLNLKIFTMFYVIGLIIVPLVSILFKTPLANLFYGKNLFSGQKFSEYLMQNFFELFTVILEYVTNTVSFLRVGAYVLVHAGLMMAVFIMANMFPSLYYLILIIGNVFVIGFEGLLVGIQVLRLEFYEIFSRCFSGGGVEFKPVKVVKTSRL